MLSAERPQSAEKPLQAARLRLGGQNPDDFDPKIAWRMENIRIVWDPSNQSSAQGYLDLGPEKISRISDIPED